MYKKETKANNRLSMDREQLMWRLNQGCTELPETPSLVTRSASNPVLAKSAPGTPSFTRRGLATGNNTNTPRYRPLSQIDFSTFGPEDFICDNSDDDM